MESQDKDQFLFDEYFSDDKDSGVAVTIPWKGKQLPFRIKRVLTLGERKRAQNAAMKIELSKDGTPKLVGGLDQSAYTQEICLAGLKKWPFEYSPGNPVPINSETMSKIDGGLADQIAARILGILSVEEATLDPSAPKLEEAS